MAESKREDGRRRRNELTHAKGTRDVQRGRVILVRVSKSKCNK